MRAPIVYHLLRHESAQSRNRGFRTGSHTVKLVTSVMNAHLIVPLLLGMCEAYLEEVRMEFTANRNASEEDYKGEANLGIWNTALL